MIDKKKVLTGLECCCMNGKGCRQCPYNKECDVMPDFGNAQLCSDALELLKEQPEQKHGHWISVPDKSPKTTTINMYSFICSCSECGKAVGHHAEYNYCPGCGAIMTRMANQDES